MVAATIALVSSKHLYFYDFEVWLASSETLYDSIDPLFEYDWYRVFTSFWQESTQSQRPKCHLKYSSCRKGKQEEEQSELYLEKPIPKRELVSLL